MNTTLNIVREQDVTTVEDFFVLSINIDNHLVDEIVSKVPDMEVDENSVAALLYTIERCRILSIVEYSDTPEDYLKIRDRDLEHNIVKLLQRYDIDNLLEIFEDMKYFEIQDILEDNNNPVKALRKYLC